jgi:hypothetical protein
MGVVRGHVKNHALADSVSDRIGSGRLHADILS